MLQRIAIIAIGAPRCITAVAVLVMVGAAIFGAPVTKSLSAGGFQDPTSESAQANRVLVEKFDRAEMQLLITLSAPGGATSAAVRAVGLDIVDRLRRSPRVADVTSAWTADSPQAAARLVSRDGTLGLIVAGITGGEDNAQKYADSLTTELVQDRDGVTVRAGGSAMVYAQATRQTERDLLLMESVAIPLSFLVLVWVFGGLLAAALPIAVSVLAIVGSMSVLRLIAFSTDVSIFALNLTTALGMALAIDYTLLIVSRYRDELADGADREPALIRTMATAGRTVLFSAVTVALSMATMILFPMFFLKSFAYAGIATVAFAAVAALVVTPAAIMLLGHRLDTLDIGRLARRLLRRPEQPRKPVEQVFWYRSTKFVMRRAVLIGGTVVAVLLLLGAPFLGVRWGFSDDRELPTSASAHEVGDQLRNNFGDNSSTAVTVVVPEANGLDLADLERYAMALSRVREVSAVTAPSGTLIDGNKVGPSSGSAGISGGSAFLTVSSTAPLYSDSSDAQLAGLHAVAGPGGRSVLMTGVAQTTHDSVHAITSRMPAVLGLIAGITFVLLFLLTGSVLLPLKALVLNVLSLTGTFGALVWIFQDGHLWAFGTTPTGTLMAHIPVLLFCIAFGLSMDYEVFVISRIREYWLASGRTGADNDESVALGLAHTGRVITAAAAVMSISFAALIAAQVSFMRMFGVGLTLAVLVDATLVRMVLVPAFMHVLGKWNWWAPWPLTQVHARIGISDSDSVRRSAQQNGFQRTAAADAPGSQGR